MKKLERMNKSELADRIIELWGAANSITKDIKDIKEVVKEMEQGFKRTEMAKLIKKSKEVYNVWECSKKSLINGWLKNEMVEMVIPQLEERVLKIETIRTELLNRI